MELWFKYRILLPLLSFLPQTVAYRLASFFARFINQQHLADTAVIKQQMQMVFKNKNPIDIESDSDYFSGLIEREALDTFFLEPCKRLRKLISL
ncbi:MAG: hypothetical protein HOP02_16285 [Methylococcaceae bacterium]|nr:hypothetical protein [Methylococcaceae bacterium]